MEADRDPGGLIRLRLSEFMHILRHHGFAVGLAEARDALTILGSTFPATAADMRPALKCLFCGRPSDWETFDAIFDAHWLGRGLKVALRGAAPATSRPSPLRPRGASEAAASAQGAPERSEPDAGEDRDEASHPRPSPRAASRAEHLAKTDFRHITDPAEMAEAHALAGRLARAMRHRLTRRHRAKRHGRRLDLRRTIHRSLAKGGVPIELVWRRRKPQPLRLVLLLDVSGSMAPYAPVFMRFMHGVLDAFREAETFLFHTRLMHVSPALREKDVDRAIDRLSLIATGIGGGTAIGASLSAFNRHHARRVIHARTAVMVISDGYDTGAPEALGAEMRALRRRCRRIVWLNPMAGWQDYSPAARGMQAALPYLDLFAPAHTLASLLALEPFLARL